MTFGSAIASVGYVMSMVLSYTLNGERPTDFNYEMKEGDKFEINRRKFIFKDGQVQKENQEK